MMVVDIPITPADFSHQAAAMRSWLDAQQIEPLLFYPVETEAGQSFRLEFGSEADATAFAAAFDGKVTFDAIPWAG
jgi:hypothetical protein